MTQYGVFECPECGRNYPDELPGVEYEGVWPECCSQASLLIEPLIVRSQCAQFVASFAHIKPKVV